MNSIIFFKKHQFLQWILLSKNISFYSVFEKWANLGPMFLQKHQFLQWIRHIFECMFQKHAFLQWILRAFCPRRNQNISLFKNIRFYNELCTLFQKPPFLQWIMHTFSPNSACTWGVLTSFVRFLSWIAGLLAGSQISPDQYLD